jgi:ribonucleotide reductase alpha subunit
MARLLQKAMKNISKWLKQGIAHIQKSAGKRTIQTNFSCSSVDISSVACLERCYKSRALNNNTGTIHMSNLCTEICLPQDRDNVAVCNLASLNLAAHVSNKEINWARLEESVRLAIRQLDNLIDINKLPIPEAEKSDKENRAIGLGVMGFSDTIEQLGMPYDTEHAWDFADRIFEFISYMAIDESANLARDSRKLYAFSGLRMVKRKSAYRFY